MTSFLKRIKLLRVSYLLAVLFIVSCSVGDDTPPAKTTDMTADETSRLLNWTAPGDNGNNGRATIYFVRYYDDEQVAEILGVPNLDDVPFVVIEEAVRNNFDKATQIPDNMQPDFAGSPQSFLTYRLDTSGDTQYFYAIRTNDEVGNSSKPSNVSELTTPFQSVKYVSDDAGSCIGEAVSSGDFNGQLIKDNNDQIINDIAVGDPCLGRVYLFFGQNDLTNDGSTQIDVSNADVTIIGDPDELFGASLAGIPDFENDLRTQELVIGAPGYDNGRGKVYIVFGDRDFPSVVDLSDPDVDRIEVAGENVGDGFGFAVADGDDVTNGNGLFLAGAPFYGEATGRAYVFRGNGLKRNEENPATDAGAIFTGQAEGDMFGVEVANLGRIKRNSFSEIGVGAPVVSKAYVILGQDNIDSKDLSVDTTNVVILEGSEGSSFGMSMSGDGDIDEDGKERDDLIVGAPDENSSTGSVFLYSGDDVDNSFDSGEVPPVETEFIGTSPGDRFGTSVSVMPELNFELDMRNRDTAIVLVMETINAAFGVGAPGVLNGTVYIFFGRDDFPETVLASEADVEIAGEAGETEFGNVVNGLGDVNGDYFEDFGVGGTEFMRVVY